MIASIKSESLRGIALLFDRATMLVLLNLLSTTTNVKTRKVFQEHTEANLRKAIYASAAITTA
jgi:hypothetical protein